MKIKYRVKWAFVGVTFLFGISAFSDVPMNPTPADESLSQALEKLEMPANQSAAGNLSSEKLYSVQTRYNPLRFKHEIAVGVGRGLVGSSFLNTNNLELGYRFHFSDRLSLGLQGGYYTNSFNDSGKRLFEQVELVPDVAYEKYRLDAMISFNAFYGKFRVSMDQVFYFDQYVSLGGGQVWLSTQNSPEAAGEIGFVFWMGKRWSSRLGVRDYYYNEARALSTDNVNHVFVFLNFGILLGGGEGSAHGLAQN